MTTSVLIVHDTPGSYFHALCTRFPDITFLKAENDRQIFDHLRLQEPEIMFSFRCDNISRQAQTRAAQSDSLKWIQVGGAGYDHIGGLDKIKCRVTNCSGVLSSFQAETVIGAIINLNFGFYRYREQQRQKIYRPIPWDSLAGQRLLLIGFGHIGKAVARNAKHFGMHVTAVRRNAQADPAADEVHSREALPDLLPRSDFVSLHLPLNDTTFKFFNKEMFSAMKPGAYFINSARGGVVNEEDLIEALDNKRIAGAYLDVFAVEPLPLASRLWDFDNVLLSPHYCDAVSDWQERFASFFADNLKRWLDGRELINIIK